MHHHHDHRCAPECDDQLPSIAIFGRGPKGDAAHIKLGNPDSCTETYIEGWETDSQTGEVKSRWRSENINGGELSYQYNLRPYTNPRTFTITFVYRRPGRCEWSWTTPAIPYIWSIDEDGVKEDGETIVGSGVATLFIKTVHEEEWLEKLVYPDGTTREDYNAPNPEEAWTVNISFGHGGDIEVPDFDDIAKIIGITKEDIFNILEDNSIHINGIDADSIIDYINKCDKRDLDHIHKDLGFCNTDHGDNAFGGKPTVKEYIDAIKEAAEAAKKQADKNAKTLADIVNKFYGGGTINEDTGAITWGNSGKAAVGSINILSNSTSYAILTHDGTKLGDIKVD